MVEDKKHKLQKNKGVNAGRDTSKANTYFSDSDISLGPSKSINRVKNELQTVIDLMGPSTPQFNNNSSSDADNEESIFTSSSQKCEEKSKAEDDACLIYSESGTDKTIPPDITLQEETDISIVADKNSTSLDVYGTEQTQYICPPPLLPANVIFNTECICPQVASYLHKEAMSMPCVGGAQKEYKKCSKHRNFIYNWFRSLKEKPSLHPGKCEYYTMNIKQSRSEHSPPRRLIFDLVGDGDGPQQDEWRCKTLDGFKESSHDTIKENIKTKEIKNFSNELLVSKECSHHEIFDTYFAKEDVEKVDKIDKKLHQKTTYVDSNGTTRVDVYYFDHGNSSYLRTTDSPPLVTTEALAEKTEKYTTKFWAEMFGTLHIGFSFCTSFVLQFLRFFLYSILRPLTIGLVQLSSDYFFKPCLATTFNAIIQPPLLCLYNVATSIKDICGPIAEGMGYFLRQFAVIIRAFRMIDVKRDIYSADTNKSQKTKFERKNSVDI